MTKSIFPIKTQTSCLLKWAQSTIMLDSGTTCGCHRCQHHKFDIDNFGNVHNTDLKIANRKTMLQGQWPTEGCHYCERQEQAGGISDRQYQLSQQRDPGLTPPELHQDIDAVRVTPTMLEVYFNNTCNMKCVYCGPYWSSSWEQENKIHGSLEKYRIKERQSTGKEDYQKALSNLWIWLEQDDLYKTLRRFSILGGEPFLMDQELDQFLSFWEKHPNPDLVIAVTSNLNVPSKLIDRYYDRFQWLVENKHIWKFQLTASLDCWGPAQEYVRSGLDLELWKHNFEKMVDQSWATVGINSAISSLTIKNMPELMERINAWNLRRPSDDPIWYSFNTVGLYMTDCPEYMGPGVFENDFKKILDIIPEHDDHNRAIKPHIKAIESKISMRARDHEKVKLLKEYLDVLDARRSTNWKETFPWLVEIE